MTSRPILCQSLRLNQQDSQACISHLIAICCRTRGVSFGARDSTWPAQGTKMKALDRQCSAAQWEAVHKELHSEASASPHLVRAIGAVGIAVRAPKAGRKRS
jgi:hypothetical protein